MTISIEEKERRAEERRRKKWNNTHKFINNIDHKLCNICNEWKPSNTENFYANKSNGVDGLHPYCKDCAIEKQTIRHFSNKDHCNQVRKEYYWNNREHYQERQKEYDARRKDEKSEYAKGWRNDNRDKLKGYGEDRRQHKKHEISDREWFACKEYFNNSCAYCALPIDNHWTTYAGELKLTDLHKEHVNHEGSNKLDNCIPSCRTCNVKKRQSNLYDWYLEDNPVYSVERMQRIESWLGIEYKRYIENN